VKCPDSIVILWNAPSEVYSIKPRPLTFRVTDAPVSWLVNSIISKPFHSCTLSVPSG
jgi:hypothetical protein